LAEILAVHRPKYEVALLFGVTDIAEWSTVAREMLHRKNTALRKDAACLVIRARRYYRRMWFYLAEVKHLSVPKEKHDTGLQHVLEYEVFVVVAALDYVAHDQIIDSSFPLCSQLVRLSVVVDLFLSNFSVENLFIHTSSKIGRDSTLCVLN